MLDRLARRERWASFFPPWALATAGAAVSAAFLFQRSLPVRIAMFACFLLAAWLSGKKVSLVSTLLASAGIVAANLLVPVGRVLAHVGPLAITESALLDGVGKALVFEGLIYASKASILGGLRLPGRFGALVAAAFVYYDRIVEYKGSVKPATLIEDADRLMLELWDEVLEHPVESGTELSTASEPPHRLAGRPSRTFATAALIAAVLASYALLIVKL
jgi:hypothetical protein